MTKYIMVLINGGRRNYTGWTFFAKLITRGLFRKNVESYTLYNLIYNMASVTNFVNPMVHLGEDRMTSQGEKTN